MALPTRRTRVLVGAVALGASAVMLAACGSSSDSESSASPAATSASASASVPEPGGSMLPPVIVPDDATTATAKVGDTIVFNVEDPVGTKIATDTPDLLDLTQGYNDGSATFNPGATALKAGQATVTLTEPDEPVRTVTITIE